MAVKTKKGAENSVGLASGLGLEPRLLGPEPSVLPLDDPEIIQFNT